MTKLDQMLRQTPERPVAAASRQAITTALAQLHDIPQMAEARPHRRRRWVVVAGLAAGLLLAAGLSWEYFQSAQSANTIIANDYENQVFHTPESMAGAWAPAQTVTDQNVSLTASQVYADQNGYGFTLSLPPSLAANTSRTATVDFAWTAAGASQGLMNDDTTAAQDASWRTQHEAARQPDQMPLVTTRRTGGTVTVNVVTPNTLTASPAQLAIRRIRVGKQTVTGDWTFTVQPLDSPATTLRGSTGTATATLTATRAGALLTVNARAVFQDKAPETYLLVNNKQIPVVGEDDTRNGERMTSVFTFALTSQDAHGPLQVVSGQQTITLK